MTDQVKFGADASEYFDVAARMQETIDRLAAKAEQSGGRHEAASGKYLESTRRVRRELGELAQDFAESGDAADLLTSGIGRISEVLKIGLGPGIAASVGVAVFEVINKQIEAARKLHEEIESITSEQGGGEFRGFDSIDKHISDIKAKLDELKISSTSTGRQLSHLALDFAVGVLSGGIAYGHSAKDDRAQILADEAKINAAQIADLNAIAQREEIITSIGRERNRISTLGADLDQAKLDFLQKQADAFQKYNVPGGEKQLGAIQDALGAQYADQIGEIRLAHELTEKKTEEEIRISKILGSNTDQYHKQIEALEQQVRFTKELYNSSEGRSKEERQALLADYEKARAALKNFQQETKFAREAELSALKATTLALQLQADGMDDIASAVKERLDFELKIAQALHDGKDDLAAQLKLEEAASKASKDRKYNDRNKPSLSELAGAGNVQAKQAQELNERARAAYARGNTAEGDELTRRADLIAQNIPGLRDEEKRQTPEQQQAAAEEAAQQEAERQQAEKDQQAREEAAAQRAKEDAALADKYINKNFGGNATGVDRNVAAGLQRQKDAFDDYWNRDDVKAAIKEQQDAVNTDLSGAQTGPDFSSLKELSQADFSNVQMLANMDFQGIAPLNGLTLTIA